MPDTQQAISTFWLNELINKWMKLHMSKTKLMISYPPNLSSSSALISLNGTTFENPALFCHHNTDFSQFYFLGMFKNQSIFSTYTAISLCYLH